VQFDAVGQPTVMVGSGAQTLFNDGAVRVTFLQTFDAVLQRGRSPEGLLHLLVGGRQLMLIPQLGQDNVPGEERHYAQHDEH
jgi:hypothetical protein